MNDDDNEGNRYGDMVRDGDGDGNGDRDGNGDGDGDGIRDNES